MKNGVTFMMLLAVPGLCSHAKEATTSDAQVLVNPRRSKSPAKCLPVSAGGASRGFVSASRKRPDHQLRLTQ
jgi:hypothetical protein